MKFEFSTDIAAGETRISALPNDYDGEPFIREVVYHYVPQGISNDAKAIICYLLFRDYIGNEIICPAPCSAQVASSLTKLHRHSLNVWEVTTTEREIQRSGQPLLLQDESPAARFMMDVLDGCPRLVVKSDSAAGRFVSKECIYFYSNAEMLARDNSLSQIVNRLAAAVLIAEDLFYDSVILPLTFFGFRLGCMDGFLGNLRAVLASVDLRLEFPVANVYDETLRGINPPLASNRYTISQEEQFALSHRGPLLEDAVLEHYMGRKLPEEAIPASTIIDPVHSKIQEALPPAGDEDISAFLNEADSIMSRYNRSQAR